MIETNITKENQVNPFLQRTSSCFEEKRKNPFEDEEFYFVKKTSFKTGRYVNEQDKESLRK